MYFHDGLLHVSCVCFSFDLSVFSCLLIFFETGLGKWEGFIRKYFGFMYSYTGRTVFTLLYLLLLLYNYLALSLWSLVKVIAIEAYIF